MTTIKQQQDKRRGNIGNRGNLHTHPRRDLLYRNLDGHEEADTYSTDERLDRITEKVIELMDKTDPQDWNSSQWKVFQEIWKEKKSSKTAEAKTEDKTSEMNSEDLRKLLNGNHSTSAS